MLAVTIKYSKRVSLHIRQMKRMHKATAHRIRIAASRYPKLFIITKNTLWKSVIDSAQHTLATFDCDCEYIKNSLTLLERVAIIIHSNFRNGSQPSQAKPVGALYSIIEHCEQLKRFFALSLAHKQSFFLSLAGAEIKKRIIKNNKWRPDWEHTCSLYAISLTLSLSAVDGVQCNPGTLNRWHVLF